MTVHLGTVAATLLLLACPAHAALEEIEGTIEIRYKEIGRVEYRDMRTRTVIHEGIDKSKTVGFRLAPGAGTTRSGHDRIEGGFLWIRFGKQQLELDCTRETQKVLRLVSVHRSSDTVTIAGHLGKSGKFEVSQVLSHSRKVLTGVVETDASGSTLRTTRAGSLPLDTGDLASLIAKAGADQTIRVRGLVCQPRGGPATLMVVTGVEAQTSGLSALRSGPSGDVLAIKGLVGSGSTVWAKRSRLRGYQQIDHRAASGWIDATVLTPTAIVVGKAVRKTGGRSGAAKRLEAAGKKE